jgi:cysteine desulfurase/selenocysteine lyase
MFDIQQIRTDFPLLARTVYGKPLVYLDNGATTQKPRVVVEAIADEYYSVNANVHRGVHFLSQKATELHEGGRETVRRFIGARHSHEIIFTRGTTESINLIASSFGEAFMKAGDEVIGAVMEHHRNIVPWQLLAQRTGIVLKVIPMNDRGELLTEEYEKLFSPRTRLVSIAHISNVLGTVNPVKEMIATAHAHGVPVVVDAAQSIPHTPVDVQALDADFLVFSAHKVYAPTGVGVLYGKEEWLEKMPPYQGGGEMIQHVSFERTTFNELPFKFEAGTPDYIGVTGLAKALDYVSALGMAEIAAYEHELTTYATRRLKEIPGMRIFGEAAEKGSVISFLVGDIHHSDMGTILDKLGIAVRTGHHCAQPLMQRLGIEGTVRASFSFYNTREEVDVLAAGIERVMKMFHHS